LLRDRPVSPTFDAEEAIFTEYATELIVIMSLMTVGLAIDRPFSWRHWKQVLPLLLVTMPLCIAGVAWLGWSWLGLSPAAASPARRVPESDGSRSRDGCAGRPTG